MKFSNALCSMFWIFRGPAVCPSMEQIGARHRGVATSRPRQVTRCPRQLDAIVDLRLTVVAADVDQRHGRCVKIRARGLSGFFAAIFGETNLMGPWTQRLVHGGIVTSPEDAPAQFAVARRSNSFPLLVPAPKAAVSLVLGGNG